MQEEDNSHEYNVFLITISRVNETPGSIKVVLPDCVLVPNKILFVSLVYVNLVIVDVW